MSEENSKAIQEVAKATKKGFEISEKLGGFLSDIFGDGFKNIGDSFTDWTIYFRYKNILILHDKVTTINKERKKQGKSIPIPPRYALPLLESATLEDNDELLNKWAGLIANATDPNKRIKIQKIYIQILSSLEPLDALLMDYVSKQDAPIKVSSGEFPNINAEHISEFLSQDISDVFLSLSNLFRLGCLIDSWQKQTWTPGRGFQGFRVNNPESDFRLSHLGKMLIEACRSE